MSVKHPKHHAFPDAANAKQLLAKLWHDAGLTPEALSWVDLGHDASAPLAATQAAVLSSSFAVASAAQASLAAAALAAARLWALRHPGEPPQRLRVDRRHATLECMTRFQIDGQTPPMWDKLSGLYRCGDALTGQRGGWVRLHANFAHHRDAALRLLGLPEGDQTERPAVTQALTRWQAEDVELVLNQAGGVTAAARSLAQWDEHAQGQAVAAQALLQIDRIADADPLPWPTVSADRPPLSGLRVLELTRILAGPVAGRCLAAYGADVLLVNGPHLPNIEAIADTSRGKLSCQIDLRQPAGREQLADLSARAHVFLQGYRPGSLDLRGLSAQQLAHARPGIVVAELSAYGWTGPWAGRRGFDSLVQTATGLNLAEAAAAGKTQPQALPLPILDYAAGHLLAFGAQAALLRQQTEGGSWRVRVSLAGVGHWLRQMGQRPQDLATVPPAADEFEALMDEQYSGFGRLRALRHTAQFSRTPAGWTRPAMPPGSHAPAWPAPED